MTPEDAIKAASSVARDVADGRLDLADLDATAVAQCRALFGTVAGPGDPLWALHLDVARQVLALDGVPADELAEWLAVARQRAGEPVASLDPADTLAEPVEAEPDDQPEPPTLAVVEPEPMPDAAPAPKRRTGDYDPLAGWSPGTSRRS
jgi:hypothetical protein